MKLIVVFILIYSCVYSQAVFYQDVFKGNVCVVGLSSWDTTNIVLQNYGTSNIRKAFLISGGQIDNVLPDMNYPIRVSINNHDYFLNNSTRVTNRFDAENLQFSGCVHVVDVSNAITSTTFQTIVHVDEYYQSIPTGENNNIRYYGMSLVVLYDDPTKNSINFGLWLNDQSLNNWPIHHSYDNLMPINTSDDVGVSISTGHLRSTIPTIQDGSYVWINNDSIGLIGGDDEWNISSLGTIMGQFSYENGNLHGIGDDTNSPFMDEADALVNIKNFLQNNVTSFDLSLHYQKPNATQYERSSNPIWATYITYTSPCAPFTVSVPNDTTICQGSTLQLNASGGQSYEWLSPTNSTTGNPAPGLSCTNCPNPLFSADSSMFYTVRIWNNDSCSVVRPVHITVKEPPVLPQLSTVKAQCGLASGSIVIQNPKETGELYILSANGDTLVKPIVVNQNTSQGGLYAGNYTVYFQDSLGCKSDDTLINIASYNNTVADFTATPQSGAAPLTVHIDNISQNAQNYSWLLNGVLQATPFNSFVADTSGSYQITLIAWQNDSSCADTATLTVLVYDSLIIGIPNVFTPNGDGINDFFSISTNFPVNAQLFIINRWGEEVFSYSGKLIVGDNKLWNGNQVTAGVYFYTLVIDNQASPNCPAGNCQLKKEGFVTVVR